MGGSLRNCATALVALSVLVSSTASAAPQTVDPLVALSVFGTSESRAAICAAGAQAAAAAATNAVVQPGMTGCVLPVMDAAPPPAQAGAAPAAIVPVAANAGIAALPLMAGLFSIAAFAAVVILHSDKDGEINFPISP